ncbi:MAG: hypothetical protein ACRDFQ_09960 [Anaerolineales bacterium]
MCAVSRWDIDRDYPLEENKAARWAVAALGVLGVAIWAAMRFPQPLDAPSGQLQTPEIPIERVIGLDPVPIEDRDEEPSQPPPTSEPPPATFAPTPPPGTPTPTEEPQDTPVP